MSDECLVLLVKEPPENCDIEGMLAEVLCRFAVTPSDEYLHDLATKHPRHRVYCLPGGATWFSGSRAGEQ